MIVNKLQNFQDLIEKGMSLKKTKSVMTDLSNSDSSIKSDESEEVIQPQQADFNSKLSKFKGAVKDLVFQKQNEIIEK